MKEFCYVKLKVGKVIDGAVWQKGSVVRVPADIAEAWLVADEAELEKEFVEFEDDSKNEGEED